MGYIKAEVLEYLRGILPGFEGELEAVRTEALDEGIPIVPIETARFLAVFLSLVKPERVLEIGCAVGFSAGLIAEFMGDFGEIVTIDRYEFMIDRAKPNFKRLGIDKRVRLIEGDALKILPELVENGEKFDLIFIDAAKAHYLTFLKHCVKMLTVGGVIIADDVLQNGTVTRETLSVARRQRTTHKRMNWFLKSVCNTDGLLSCVVPIGDGMVVSVKTKEEIVFSDPYSILK